VTKFRTSMHTIEPFAYIIDASILAMAGALPSEPE